MSRNESLILVLSGILILVASTIYFFLPALLEIINPPNSKYIGMVVKAEGDLRMRFGDSMNWRSVKAKDKIYSQTYLFTGTNSSAIYGFTDESSITLGENSLIYLDSVEPPAAKKGDKQEENKNVKKGVSLELVEGEMQVNLNDQSTVKTIKVEDSELDLTKHQKMVVKLVAEEKKGVEIAVYEGDIQVKRKKGSYEVKEGEKVDVAPKEEPKAGVIDKKTLEQIKLEAEKDQKRVVEDLKKKRQLGYILHEFMEILKGNIN